MKAKKQRTHYEISRVRAGRKDVWTKGHLGWTWKLLDANGNFMNGPHQNFENEKEMWANLRAAQDTNRRTKVIVIPYVEPAAQGPATS